jgi:hypothetical protein
MFAATNWREYDLVSRPPRFNRAETFQLPTLSQTQGTCVLSVTSITFTNVIRTVTEEDYITINGTKYNIHDSRTHQTVEGWSNLLNQSIHGSGVHMFLDSCQIQYFSSTWLERDDPEEPPESFAINDMSYNVMLLCGIDIYRPFPLHSTNKEIWADQFGDFNSTPVFYIQSGLGSSVFVQQNGILKNNSVLMRFNNSLLQNLPVMYIGGEYKRESSVSQLASGVQLTLVDANMREVDLLYPMRVSLFVSFH